MNCYSKSIGGIKYIVYLMISSKTIADNKILYLLKEVRNTIA